MSHHSMQNSINQDLNVKWAWATGLCYTSPPPDFSPFLLLPSPLSICPSYFMCKYNSTLTTCMWHWSLVCLCVAVCALVWSHCVFPDGDIYRSVYESCPRPSCGASGSFMSNPFHATIRFATLIMLPRETHTNPWLGSHLPRRVLNFSQHISLPQPDQHGNLWPGSATSKPAPLPS